MCERDVDVCERTARRRRRCRGYPVQSRAERRSVASITSVGKVCTIGTVASDTCVRVCVSVLRALCPSPPSKKPPTHKPRQANRITIHPVRDPPTLPFPSFVCGVCVCADGVFPRPHSGHIRFGWCVYCAYIYFACGCHLPHDVCVHFFPSLYSVIFRPVCCVPVLRRITFASGRALCVISPD